MKTMLAVLSLVLSIGAAHAAQLEIDLPLARHAYQTNEQIYLAVVRSDANALSAGNLTLTITTTDGSKMLFDFPVKAAPVAGKDARCVEHVLLNGWLLRPGNYKVEAACDGTTAVAGFEVFSHIRKSSFILADWGNHAAKNQQVLLGEDSVGFNLNLAGYGGIIPDEMIQAGTDFMRCCTMGGAHQMDMRHECDWSDPYVLHGSEARVVREAMQDRTSGNCMGVHFYDEPGLTWWKNPKTDTFVPDNIPAQDRSFFNAFGKPCIQYQDVKPNDPASVAQWKFLGNWKLSFMDAAWKYSAFGVSDVKSDFLSVTQSVYGWSSYCDGYYFPITRSLPVISGHGGYDDLGSGYMFPSFTFEFGRMRELNKPNWYLPVWYLGTNSDHFRCEQYLSFMNNLQGMMTPPDHRVHTPSADPNGIDGIVESNKLFARLGTIFTTMPVTRPPAAVLYSMSHNLHAQSQDLIKNPANNFGNHMNALQSIYLASKLNQTPVFPIVDEDILDGTLAANHKAVILGGIDFLDPKVIATLETYAADGGLVLLTDDCKVTIKGSTKLGIPVDYALYDAINKAYTEKNMPEVWRLDVVPNYFKSCAGLATALKAKLGAAGIQPVFETESATLAASRQALGDVEYDFAVNITPDPTRLGKNNLKPLTASIGLPGDDRPIYDAITGGPATQFAKKGATLSADFRFGPGEMRVFARTARPIGSVQVMPPVVYKDYTLQKNPIRLDLTAMVADTKGRILSGSIPLQIRVTDPLGAVRFELFRATDRGTCHVELPLAVNDANGQWTVTVRELLANTEDTATFAYGTPKSCGALAGAIPRATYFSDDRSHIFKFFRTHRMVTIVAGSSSYDRAAAERISASLKPWDVTSTIVDAADVSKPRTLTEEEAKSWTGMMGGTKKPADANLRNVGFALQGPAILVGTPDDNPMIKFAQDEHFLPYVADKVNFPGAGRGYLAWQRDAIGYGQESLTVIAFDAEGMDEAAGTLYEAAAGIDPVMALNIPLTSTVSPASQYEKIPALKAAWRTALPDNAASHKLLADGSLLVLTKDGSLTKLDAAGKSAWSKGFDGAEKWTLDAAADGSLIVVGASQHLLGFDASGKQLFDTPFTFHEPGREGTPVSPCVFVAISPDKSQIAASALNGHLMMFDTQGKQKWTVGGVTDEEFAKWQADTKEWESGIDKRAKEQAEFKPINDAFKLTQKAWDDGAKEREAKTNEFKKAHDKWARDVKAWEKTKDGEKPVEPAAPVLPPKPEAPKGPPNPPRPQQPKPMPFNSGFFTTDGKALICVVDNGFVAVDTEKGTVGAKQGGFKVGTPFFKHGDDIVMTDGQSKVSLFSLAANKVTKQLALTWADIDPKTNKPRQNPIGVYSMVPNGDGLLIAGEVDSTVYAVKSLEGEQAQAVTWQYKDPRRLVKYITVANNLAAVVYFGGWMTVLDATTGAPKYAQNLGQDATFAEWSGAALLVGTADGRITALSEK